MTDDSTPTSAASATMPKDSRQCLREFADGLEGAADHIAKVCHDKQAVVAMIALLARVAADAV